MAEDINILTKVGCTYTSYIARMLVEYNAETSPYFKAETRFLNDPYEEYQFQIIAFDNQVCTGGAVMHTKFKWWFIDLMCILPEYRSKGIGTQILQKLIADARANGCLGLRAEISDFHDLAFFKKFGFEQFGVLENYPEGATTYSLCLRLNTHVSDITA